MKGIIKKVGSCLGALVLSASLGSCESNGGSFDNVELGPVKELNAEEFVEAQNYDVPSAIAVHSYGCTACPSHIETFVDVSDDYVGELFMGVFEAYNPNGENNWDLLHELGITTVPHTLCFYKGEFHMEYIISGGHATEEMFRSNLDKCAALDD